MSSDTSLNTSLNKITINNNNSKKKIFIIAGEASGDYLGAKLMEDIKSIRDDVEFKGIGGSYMRNVGLDLILSSDQLSIIGIWEVVKKIFYIKGKIKETVQSILDYKPDVLVTIDFPGFTSQVHKALRNALQKSEKNIPIVHYVAPSIWAWRSDRAKNMQVDKLLALLPFEPALFAKYGVNTVFVGHPVATDTDFSEPSDYVKNEFLHSIGFTPRYDKNTYQWRDNVKNWDKERVILKFCTTLEEQEVANNRFYRQEHHMNTYDYFRYKIILLLPGSRKSEIDYHMPVLKEFADIISDRYKENVRFIIPTTEALEEKVREYTESWNKIPIITTAKKDKILAYYVSDVAVAASGTVNLELARAEVPSVIIYKTSNITAKIVEFLIKVPYVSLINILSKEKVVPELLQKDCNAGKIFEKVTELLDDLEKREEQKRKFRAIISSLIPNDSKIAAKEVVSYLNKN